MASCEWLNLAVGCDTGSSMRGPAGLGGLFGSRPTHGTVQLRHAMPPSPTMDTAGFLARDPSLMDAKSKALYKSNYTSYDDGSLEYPKTLYVLDFPTTTSASSQRIL
ncbi:Amidase 1 [Colletotrichum fructicola]|uniref:Amidase 1 n=1 Tax=Colletotrichum fructicola (strain Nara gc5) TaxID=1213859 RepID=A0A7J6JC56_COLFN|nr:uncharacterized protein CGMCC3_g4378 [Colletotrichum fructicola]KAF4487034.1 Amidase 1 [Colletotrichum fructicola Nara gc5]KAE9579817.1 hypothetical protein CGMCC3_g4378 [Colletotrichum fructicola]KAF4895096.1 Amidase 1 [Colletotrichum fructicola]KAF4896861.1 Amidase 1 [Colletotrichum fructicola]KAF4936057.1 Amidase 1 [Colletotrichum fructicola]